ncbi:MAG: hypothetical protein EWM47_05635 [Anaerolineaceae bacterium]|nr:MAG: hypothetical protein EWM47_05635 [Anaerolineaceae bacterium]
MKVAFWSNEYEKSGAFLNFVAISIASVMCTPYTISILENYLGKDNLEKAFFDNFNNIHLGYGGVGFYEGGGIEGLLRRVYRGDKHPSLLRHYLKEVIPKHLYYVPQSGVINSKLFDYELHHNLKELFSIIERNTDLCYINTRQQNYLSSNEILHEADLIVINLYQNPEYLEEFFKNYSSLISKSLFIIGNYSPKAIMSCKRISRTYDIPLENFSPIPYNEYFDFACNYGEAKEFINRNYFCTRENSHYLFIHGVRKAAYMISKKIESIHLGNEEMEHCGILL